MFIKIMFYYLIGYVKITIEGYYIERFMNICTNQKIIIWNIKRKESVKLTFYACIKDFKEIVKIAKKTKCKLKIEKKRGIPFILHRYKKRKIFVIFLIMIFILIGISSQFIWNIELQIEDNVEIENITEDIREAGLTTGTLKSKIKTKEVINKVRLNRNDIAWMGIEIKGTNAIVKLVKADEKPEMIDEDEYCNIVSNKDGIITKLNVQNGTAAVKVGDTVKAGTTLINGWMEGKYTGLRYVYAKGEIEAKVWYTESTIIPYTSTETIETGNIENSYGIKINDFKINFPKGVSKFEFYDTIEEEKKFRLFSNFYLPISVIKTTNKEVKKEQKTYSQEEAKNIGIEQLEEKLNNKIEDKTKIVNKNVNTYEKQEGLEIYVTYEVLESIGTNEKIVF